MNFSKKRRVPDTNRWTALSGIAIISLVVVLLSGCGTLSATTLRCGTDSESSYVEITSAPQAISANVRALSELCGFAYQDNESS